MSCCWGEKCALVSVWSLQWSGFAVSESENLLSLSLSAHFDLEAAAAVSDV
jgi:hypothetical protein